MGTRPVIWDLDMFTIGTGHIFTSYGSYAGDLIRGRVTYYPASDGDREFEGHALRKVYRERVAPLASFEMLADHPGEQQYAIPRESIVAHFRPSSKALLPDSMRRLCSAIAQSLSLAEEDIGATGSRALGIPRSSADTDLVVRTGSVAAVRDAVRASPGYHASPHWSMRHVFDKYAHFGLTESDISLIFGRRWRHFRIGDDSGSVCIVHPELYADQFMAGSPDERATILGTVVGGAGTYHCPRRFSVRSRGRETRVVAWSFLYNGALQDGDLVEVTGRWTRVGGADCLVVDDCCDRIRVVRYGSG